MQTVYNWSIPQMEEKPQEGSLLDVVVKVYFTRMATLDFEGKVYNSKYFGSYDCPSPSPTDYTAYPDLTESQVIGWLEAGLDVALIDAQLDAQIEVQINPPVIALPLPWIAETTTTTTEAPVTSTTTTLA
jgi:hypothetical protein